MYPCLRQKFLKYLNLFSSLSFLDDSTSNASQHILKELENIDDDCDRHNIPFVKIDDSSLESSYGIKNPPALGFYKKQVPKFFDGKIFLILNVLHLDNYYIFNEINICLVTIYL